MSFNRHLLDIYVQKRLKPQLKSKCKNVNTTSRADSDQHNPRTNGPGMKIASFRETRADDKCTSQQFPCTDEQIHGQGVWPYLVRATWRGSHARGGRC